MNILRVIASMDPATGGPCQGIRNSVEAMSQFNITNEIVSLDTPDATFLGIDNFKIVPLGTTKNPWAYSQKLVPWLSANIQNYDAVIVHGLWLYPGMAVKKAMRTISPANRPQWFVMPHGMLDPYFQNAPDRKAKAVRNRLYWKLFESKVIESANGLLFTCSEEELLARTTFKPYRPKQTVNVGYGILPPPADTMEMKIEFLKATGLRPDDRYFIFLSRIHPKKGVDLLIDAYSKIINQASNTEFIPKLVVAGPGLDTDFGKQIIARVSSDDYLNRNVVFPGMLSGNAKWGAFYHAEAFILPSHQENFGIAVAEALACATPVLISDKVNIWREIEQGGGGIIQSDTIDGTYALITEWNGLTNTQKSKMKEAAFETYTAHFEINTVIKNLINIIYGKFAPPESRESRYP